MEAESFDVTLQIEYLEDKSYNRGTIMLAPERQAYISEFVDEYGNAEVETLAEKLGVSSMTIRRDLKKLEKEGKLNRCHGGAFVQTEVKYLHKQASNHEIKKKIAHEASKLVDDGMSVYIDAGTTAFEVALLLGQKNIQIVTNDIMVAANASGFKAEVFICGGHLQKSTESIWGPYATEMLKDFRFDISFIGAAAIDKSLNSLTPTPEKAFMKRLAGSQSQKSCLVVDASKFDKNSFNLIENLTGYDIIITDYQFSLNQLKLLGSHQTQIINVD